MRTNNIILTPRYLEVGTSIALTNRRFKVTRIWREVLADKHSDHNRTKIFKLLAGITARYLQVAQKAGYQGAIALSTSDYSRRIFEKIGMTTVKKMDWDEFEIEGKKVLKDVKSACAASHFIKL